MNLKSKIHSATSLLSYFFRGDFIRFFYETSKFFPNWIFKFNEGVLISTSSPKIIFRNYKRYIFVKASPDDAADIVTATGMTAVQVAERFGADQECYIARDTADKNKIVNIIWVNRQPCQIRGVGLSIDIDEGAAYLYGGQTSPEARMKGIFNTALKQVYSALNDQGIRKLYALIEYWNKNSYDYHMRLGFRPLTRVIFISVLSLKITFLKDLVSGQKRCRIFIFPPEDRLII